MGVGMLERDGPRKTEGIPHWKRRKWERFCDKFMEGVWSDPDGCTPMRWPIRSTPDSWSPILPKGNGKVTFMLGGKPWPPSSETASDGGGDA